MNTVTKCRFVNTWSFVAIMAIGIPVLLSLSNAVAATNVSGTISVDTTWTLSGSPYIVTGDVSVNAGGGVTLTIEPGVTVKFNADTGLYIGNSGSGDLIAVGTPTSPITFTSNEATLAPGQWKGLYFGHYAGTATQFKYCIVEYGGKSNNANVYVFNNLSGLNLTIQSSTIRFSSAYGVYCRTGSKSVISQNSFTDNGTYPLYVLPVMQVSGNTFTGNGNQAIEVEGGTVSVDTTWKKEPVPYVIDGDIAVNAGGGVTLTIEPGVTVKFNAGTGLYIGNGNPGALIAAGTAVLPITFTSNEATPAPGQWKGVYFGYYTESATTQFNYCTVEYGGMSHNANVYVSGVKPTIQASTLRKSSQSGVRISGTGSNGALITCNRFENNLYGVYTESNAQPLINYNDFVTNQNYGVYNASTIVVNAQNNWWNDADGPNLTGDKTYGNVTSSPYLTSPSQFCSTTNNSYLLWTK